jgi:hypothetical protein
MSVETTKKPAPVGYGHPPKAHQYKPGHSGNPKGRPKGVKNLSTDVAEELAEKIPVTEHGKSYKITKQRALIKTLVAKGLKGDMRAAAQIIGLTPLAEQSRAAALAQKTLSAPDRDILAALRSRFMEEISQSPPESDDE